MNNILNPSLNVFSLEYEPSGLLKYLADISSIGKRICRAYIVSSVSISNPLESAGKLFTNLLEKNGDVIGWIQIPGTNINYPFVQSTDNSFYLTHNLKGEYNSAGWIFADYNNNLEDLDKNTIIYGHNRLNDSMFAELEKALDKDWYENEENRYIIFSTKYNDYIGEIISIYKIKASDFSANYNYTDEEFLNYIADIKSKSIYDFETDVDVSDKIVTLYTCDKTSENRIILQAKLIEY